MVYSQFSKYFMFSGFAILTIHYNLLVFVVSAAEFFRVTLRQVTACVRPMLTILFCLQQVRGQSQLLLESGALQRPAADNTQVTVLQRSEDRNNTVSLSINHESEVKLLF